MANVSSSNSQKALVPKLRFPGFEGEWHCVKLSDKAVFRKNRGQTNKTHFVSTENMKQSCAGIELYPDTEYAEGIKFQEADILIANIRPYLKKAWLATFSGACSADVLALCPVNILPSFLYSVISRDSFFDYVMSGAKGSKMPRGDKTHIMAYSFGVPGCKEQKRISDMIAWLDKRIDAQRRLVEALKSYKRGLLEAIFMKKISNGFLRNEKWEKVCVGDILEVKHGRDYKDQPSDIGLHPVVGTGGQICKIDTYLCDWPCVCIGRKGTIDRPQYFDTPFWSVDTLFYTKPKAENNPRFQYYLFETIPWATYNEASSVPSLSASTIEQIPVEIPSKVTQDNLARFLSAVDAKIEISNCLLAKLIQAKQSLLQQIFI